jgi:hypothetical protein
MHSRPFNCKLLMNSVRGDPSNDQFLVHSLICNVFLYYIVICFVVCSDSLMPQSFVMILDTVFIETFCDCKMNDY